MKQILIVIPTYNEADNIKPLVAAIEAVSLQQSAYMADLLFVDDTSPDGTTKVIQGLQRKHKNIYLLSGPKEGLGKAYIRGLEYGFKLKSYFALITMDADLSHDPKDIPRLLAELERKADYVIGSRYIAGGHTAIGYSLLRRLQSRLANVIARSFIDIKTDTKDLTGGFKAVKVNSLRTIPLEHINASGYVFQVSLLYEFAKRKYTIREVPITFHPRRHGKSKLGLRDALEFLRLTFRLNSHARLPRMIRFASVGASGTVVNLAVLLSLVRFAHLNVTLAYLIALEASIVSNFTLNHMFTFRLVAASGKSGAGKSFSHISKLLRYNLISLAGVGIALAVFTLSYHLLSINYVLADLLGIIAAMGWNYWLSIKLVWRIVDNDQVNNENPQEEFEEI